MAYETSAQERERRLAEIYSRKTKPCTRCGVEKPNDLDHFGRKLFFDRFTVVPTDVCQACTSAKVANRWRRQKWDAHEYELFKARDAVRRARAERGEAQPEVEPELWTDQDRALFNALRPVEPDCPRPD